jgi:hypothetical protein
MMNPELYLPTRPVGPLFPCQWETPGGPCNSLQPLAKLRRITYYDGREKLVCSNHYQKFVEEGEGKHCMRHVRVY